MGKDLAKFSILPNIWKNSKIFGLKRQLFSSLFHCEFINCEWSIKEKSSFLLLFSQILAASLKKKFLPQQISDKKFDIKYQVPLTKYHWCWNSGSVGSTSGGRSTRFSTFNGLYPRLSFLARKKNPHKCKPCFIWRPSKRLLSNAFGTCGPPPAATDQSNLHHG